MLLTKFFKKKYIFLLSFLFFFTTITKGHIKNETGTICKIITCTAGSIFCGYATCKLSKATKGFYKKTTSPYKKIKNIYKNLTKIKNEPFVKQKKEIYAQIHNEFLYAKEASKTTICAMLTAFTATLTGVFILSVPFILYDKYHRSQTV